MTDEQIRAEFEKWHLTKFHYFCTDLSLESGKRQQERWLGYLGAKREDEIGKLQARIRKLEGALRHYGTHEDDCVCAGDKTEHAADCANCDCGLQQALGGGQ